MLTSKLFYVHFNTSTYAIYFISVFNIYVYIRNVDVILCFSSSIIPYRANNNWQTNFASITKSNESSPQANKKQRDVGESPRDSLAYSCLLKNELLGTAIDDVKTVTDDRNENSFMPSAKRGLFKYQSPSKQVSNNNATSYFTVYSK